MNRFSVIGIGLVLTLIAAPLLAKSTKAKEASSAEPASTSATKTIAIGAVDMGQVGFSRMSPDATGELFRSRIARALEQSGQFTVIQPEVKRGDPKTPDASEVENVPEPKTPAEAMKMMQKMQAQMQKNMAQMRGEYVHQPVKANALFTFSVSRSEKRVSTGGLVGTALDLGAPSKAHVADMSAERQELTLSCYERDPQKGTLLDEHEAKAVSTRSARVSGNYIIEDTTDPDKAYDRLFKRAASDCVKWIEGKMASK